MIQVWDREKNLIFERIRSKQIETWGLSNDYFVFEEDLDRFNQSNGMEIVKKEFGEFE